MRLQRVECLIACVSWDYPTSPNKVGLVKVLLLFVFLSRTLVQLHSPLVFSDGCCATIRGWFSLSNLRAAPRKICRVSIEGGPSTEMPRRVTYLLGETDILPFGIFDASCSAMAQGPTRLARGLAFSRYVKEQHGGANHNTIVVPFCGHSARCVFTSDMALPLIFPN
jgi:hypothetical protein